MKKNGCVIAGGVLQIIGGVLWLLVALGLNDLSGALHVNADLGTDLAASIGVLLLGVLVLTPKMSKTRDLVVTGILDIGMVAIRLLANCFFALGYAQMILLGIAGVLLCCGKVTPISKQ